MLVDKNITITSNPKSIESLMCEAHFNWASKNPGMLKSLVRNGIKNVITYVSQRYRSTMVLF